MDNKEGHELLIFRERYMTPEFYGEEEIKHEEFERARKIMLDVCGLRGGNLEVLAPLSEFALSGDSEVKSRDLSSKGFNLQSFTKEVKHALIDLKEDEARRAYLVFKKHKEPFYCLTLTSYSQKVVLCPEINYEVGNVNIRVSSITNEEWPSSQEVKECDLNLFKSKSNLLGGEQPTLTLNIEKRPVRLDTTQVPFYLGSNPKNKNHLVEYFKAIEKAEAEIIARINYIPQKCWIIEAAGKTMVKVKVEKANPVFFANSIIMELKKEQEEEEVDKFYLERKK